MLLLPTFDAVTRLIQPFADSTDQRPRRLADWPVKRVFQFERWSFRRRNSTVGLRSFSEKCPGPIIVNPAGNCL
jgi:hypothetical protein